MKSKFWQKLRIAVEEDNTDNEGPTQEGEQRLLTNSLAECVQLDKEAAERVGTAAGELHPLRPVSAGMVGLGAATDTEEVCLEEDIQAAELAEALLPWDSINRGNFNFMDEHDLIKSWCPKEEELMDEFLRNCNVRMMCAAADYYSWQLHVRSSEKVARKRGARKPEVVTNSNAHNVLACLKMAPGIGVAVPSLNNPETLCGYLVSNGLSEGSAPVLMPSAGLKLSSPILDVRSSDADLLYMRASHEVCVASARVTAEIAELEEAASPWLQEKFRQEILQPTRDLCTSPHAAGVFATAHADGLRVWDVESHNIFDFWESAPPYRECLSGLHGAPNALCWWNHPQLLAMASADVSLADLRCNRTSNFISRHVLLQNMPIFDSVGALAWLSRFEHQLALVSSPGAALIFDMRRSSKPLHWWGLSHGPERGLQKYYFRALSCAEGCGASGNTDFMMVPQIGGHRAVVFSRNCSSGASLEFTEQPVVLLQSPLEEDVFLGAHLNLTRDSMHLFCLMSQSGVQCYEASKKQTTHTEHESARDADIDAVEAVVQAPLPDSSLLPRVQARDNEAVAARNWLQNATVEVAAVLEKLGFGKCTQPAKNIEPRRWQSGPSVDDLAANNAKLLDFWNDGSTPGTRGASHAPLTDVPAESSQHSLVEQSQALVVGRLTPILPLDDDASKTSEQQRQQITADLHKTLQQLEVSLPDAWIDEVTLDHSHPKQWSIADLNICAEKVGSSQYSADARLGGIRAVTRALARKGLLCCKSEVMSVPDFVGTAACESYGPAGELKLLTSGNRSKPSSDSDFSASAFLQRIKDIQAKHVAARSGLNRFKENAPISMDQSAERTGGKLQDADASPQRKRPKLEDPLPAAPVQSGEDDTVKKHCSKAHSAASSSTNLPSAEIPNRCWVCDSKWHTTNLCPIMQVATHLSMKESQEHLRRLGTVGQDSFILKQGVREVEMPADGNCLFHALGCAMSRALNINLKTAEPGAAIRTGLMEYIGTTSDAIDGTPVRTWVEWASRQTWQAYVGTMQVGTMSRDTWGSFLEVAIFCKQFEHRNIHVAMFEQVSDGYHFLTSTGKKSDSVPTCCIVWNGVHWNTLELTPAAAAELDAHSVA